MSNDKWPIHHAKVLFITCMFWTVLLLTTSVPQFHGSWTLAATLQPTRADDFVESIGVNTHLSYPNSCYYDYFNDFSKYLLESGIRKIRDSLRDGPQWYYDRHNYLGMNGIKGIFLTDNPNRPAELIRSYPLKVPFIFERYEGINEYDLRGDPNWVNVTIEWTKFMWDNHNTSFPVLAPSLTSLAAFEAVGDLSAYVDFANMHNYYGSYPPTKGWGPQTQYGFTGTVDYFHNLTSSTQVKKKKPVVTTETGWQTRLGPVIYWVPESIQAKYTLRSLMLQWMRGVERTYLYEMCDDREYFGLLYYNSTSNSEPPTPKPVYYALKNMISVLEEKPRQPKFTLKELTIEMNPNSTTNSKIQHTLFQKSNGNYYLAIWQETFGYDKGMFFNTTSLTVNLNFTQLSMFNVSLMRLYTFDTASGSMTNATVVLSKKHSNLISANFQITDTMTLVEMIPHQSSPPPLGSPSVKPVPSPSGGNHPGRSLSKIPPKDKSDKANSGEKSGMVSSYQAIILTSIVILSILIVH
ncbi:hypothetical protein C9374_006720 [Naegleria lovaniensis]|uniref:Uncharacterized protein n=1 Tax=Naegleria lovaniensis TaxID=51637 RepID=A0AA88KJ51_NAELO|nr:uncharacterized protein C9374_006720 [Naegleria lovaniensis]KAG2379603.1 hypothetical protein C9374_006720 [Naegleria lovaniensis]